MLLSTVFQSYLGNSSHYSCLSWVAHVLGWGSVVSCSRTLPQKKTTEDPVQLKPSTPWLRAKQFSTEPHRNWHGHTHFRDLCSDKGIERKYCVALLTLYQTTNFRLFQIERVCRQQFEIWRKWQKIIKKGRKHCGKRRNCMLWAISPFPRVFSKGLFPRGIRRCHCVGMG